MPREIIYGSTSGFTGWTAKSYDDFTWTGKSAPDAMTWTAKTAPSSFTWTADSMLRIADYYIDRGMLNNDGTIYP